jgi:hypothetical protein
MATEIELLESADPTPLSFGFWGLDKIKIYQRNENTRDGLLARILDAAAHVNEPEDHPRRTTRDLRTRVAECFEVDFRIVENFFVNSNKFDIFVIRGKKKR